MADIPRDRNRKGCVQENVLTGGQSYGERGPWLVLNSIWEDF